MARKRRLLASVANFRPNAAGNLIRAWSGDDLSYSDGAALASWPAAYGTEAAADLRSGVVAKNAVRNGRNVARFDGTGGLTVTSLRFVTISSPGLPPRTVARVLSFSAFHLFLAGTNTVVSNYAAYFGGASCGLFAGGGQREEAIADDNSIGLLFHATDVTDTNWHVYEFSWDGSVMRFLVDGVERAAGKLSGSFTFSEIGSAFGGTKNWTGDLGEFLFYSEPVNGPEQVRSYLKRHWNTP
jgi:hypothetical protein